MNKRSNIVGTAAVCLANTIGTVPANTSPLIIGGLIAGLALGEASAGLVLTCELLLMGIAATALATQMTHIDKRRASLAGAALILLGHGFAAASEGLIALLMWRSIAGIGGGIVLAAVNATIAGAPNPLRLYGLVLMVTPLIGAVIALIMSRAIATFAHSGAYGVLALLTLVVIPALFAFPDYRKVGEAAEPAHLTDYRRGIALLLAIFLMGANMMAYFAFVERLGVRLDLPIERIGNIFAVVVIAGAVGAGLAGALGNRIGLRLPLIVGTAIHAAAMVLVLQFVAFPAYVVGAVLEGFSYVFALTFQFALAASLDFHGRWAAAASGAFLLSLGVGPYLGGVLIETAGFGALIPLTITSTVVVLAIFWWASGETQAVAVSD